MIVRKRRQHLQNMQRLYMQQQQQMAAQYGGGGGGGGALLQPPPHNIGLLGGGTASPDNQDAESRRSKSTSSHSSTSQHFYPAADAGTGNASTTSSPALLANGHITLGLGSPVRPVMGKLWPCKSLEPKPGLRRSRKPVY